MIPAFIHHLNSAADKLVTVGWLHLVQTSVLAVLLAVIDATVGRRLGSPWRCALWLIFFLKLALPPQLSLPSSPAYWWSSTPLILPSAPRPASPPQAMMPAPDAWPTTNSTAESLPAQPLNSIPAATPSWRLLLVTIWGLGVLSLAAVTLLRHHRIAQALRSGTAADARTRAALQRARARVGLRRPVGLWLTNVNVGPLVTGLWRPIIHLPQSLVRRLTPAQLDAVLVHELSHVRRGDLWVTAIQTAARVVFFYHPAVWWANARLSRLREEATDRAVLAHSDVDARAYSLALVAAAELAAAGGAGSPFALGVIETKSQLQQRITMNLSHPRRGRSQLGWLGALSLVLLGFVLVPMAPAESAAQAPTPAGFKPLDPGPLAQRIDDASASIFAAFNQHDRDRYLAAFAPDALILAPGTTLISGRAGVAENFLQLPPGLSYERIDWRDRRIFHIGRWWIDTGVLGFQFRLKPTEPIMTDPRGSFSIWEEADDGRLNVKLLAWNRLYQPQSLERTAPTQAFVSAAAGASLSRTGDFAAVLDAEEVFHHAFETRDLKAAADYYGDDATLIAPDSTPLRGHAAIARYIEAVPPERSVATIERQVAQVEGNENYVLVVNLFRWHFTQPDSGQSAVVSGKGVHLWQKDAQGRWRILFDLCNPSQSASG